MKRIWSGAAAFASGALFSAGLVVGGMTQTAKVQGFLDFAGSWDPSLLFVMGGAVAVYFVAHRLVLGLKRPIFDEQFHLPTRRDLDPRLIGGAALFGVGWGLAGYCPGPALASVGTGAIPPIVFVLAMVAGMSIQRRLFAAVDRRRAHRAAYVSPEPMERPS